MKTTASLLIAGLLAGQGVVVDAAQGAVKRPYALGVALEKVWRADGLPIELPVADQPQTAKFELPPIRPKPKTRVCLRFRFRLHAPANSGWGPYLAIKINGRAVRATDSRKAGRLLNRRPYFRSEYGSGRHAFFGTRAGRPSLVAFFAPDFKTIDRRISSERQELCWFLLEVGDLLKERGGNRLELTNMAIKEYWHGKPPKNCRMVIDDLEVGYVGEEAIKSLRSASLVKRSFVAGPSVSGAKGAVVVPPGGGLQLKVGREIYFIESEFSHPGGGWNRLVCAAKPGSGQPGWRPTVKKVGSGTLEIRAEAERYRLTRTVRVKGHRIEVQDALVNKTAKEVGIRVRHRLIAPVALKGYRMGGVERPIMGERRSATHPTVFVTQNQTGVGIVAEDNVLRLQMGAELELNQAEFYTNHFGLAGQAGYALRWTIYPGGTDYFDFVNALRRDWNSNFTVLGPFEFLDSRKFQRPADANALRRLLKRKKIKIYCLGPWFEYYDGYRIARDRYKSLMGNAIRVIKSVQPDAVCIARMETNLSPVPISFFEGTLPADTPWGRPGVPGLVGDRGVYGWTIPAEATKRVNRSVWADSCLRAADGRVKIDTWYATHYQKPKGVNLLTYPQVGNYRYKLGLDQLRFFIEDCGLDGGYIDQFSLAFGTADRYTYERWDGHTVDIDGKTGRITRKYTDCALVGAAARAAWVDSVLSKGKIIVANTMPAVMECQSQAAFRFMETQGYGVFGEGPPNQVNCAQGQLASPIGLGYSFGVARGAVPEFSKRQAEFLMRTVIAHLRYGLLYYYYSANVPATGPGAGEYGPVNHMFPFTPRELHEGWVVGKERIITCVSGTYHWPGTERPEVLHFDSRGRRTEQSPTVRKTGDGWDVPVRLKDWHEIVVIEGR